MGRETKLLLGLLGLLAGVFVGVLSMKLFVPRPPDGAGPDVRTDQEFAETQQVVEPPTLAPRGWDFTAAPPLVSDRVAAASTAALADGQPAPEAPRESMASAHGAGDDLLAPPPAFPTTERSPPRFAAQPPAVDEEPALADDAAPPPALQSIPQDAEVAPPAVPTPVARDPFLTRATFEQPAALAPSPVPAAAAAAVSPGGRHIVQPGESWWSLAERAYGDGRLYRALFAWNRVLDPRVALAPGTMLDVPPLPKLQAAWPKLVPPPTP